MRFLRADMFEWLLILPVLVACWMIQGQYRRRVRRQSPIAPRFHALSRRTRAGTRAATLAAAVTCAGAMIFALARPQVVVATREPQFERQDLVIILDRSVSMRARDIAPSRLLRATSEIRNFLRNRPDTIDRVALVGFADSSIVLSYPTADLGSLFFYLDWIDEDDAPLFGTDIGGAIEKALSLIEKDRRKTRKVVLLISDGEDLGAELATAVGMCRTARVRVHCLGIGSDAPVSIPLHAGAAAGAPLLDEDDRPIITRFSETTLRRVAETTGGRYVRSTTGAEMAAAINTIVRGERRLVGWKRTSDYRDVYGAWLAAALAAGAALWLLL